MRMVRVEWRDAAYCDEPEDKGLSPIAGIAVGWLVEDETHHITLALEWFEDETFRRLLSIPRGMVDLIEDLDVAGSVIVELVP